MRQCAQTAARPCSLNSYGSPWPRTSALSISLSEAPACRCFQSHCFKHQPRLFWRNSRFSAEVSDSHRSTFIGKSITNRRPINVRQGWVLGGPALFFFVVHNPDNFIPLRRQYESWCACKARQVIRRPILWVAFRPERGFRAQLEMARYVHWNWNLWLL